jgi:hypothetical protein
MRVRGRNNKMFGCVRRDKYGKHSNYVELFKIVLELTCAKVINYSFCKIIIITNLAINHRGKSVMTPL